MEEKEAKALPHWQEIAPLVQIPPPKWKIEQPDDEGLVRR
jgi:hypothetical protein